MSRRVYESGSRRKKSSILRFPGSPVLRLSDRYFPGMALPPTPSRNTPSTEHGYSPHTRARHRDRWGWTSRDVRDFDGFLRYIRGTRFTECWEGERCRLRVGYFNRPWLQPSERFRLALLGRVLKAGVPIVDLLRYLGQRDGDSNYVVFHPILRSLRYR